MMEPSPYRTGEAGEGLQRLRDIFRGTELSSLKVLEDNEGLNCCVFLMCNTKVAEYPSRSCSRWGAGTIWEIAENRTRATAGGELRHGTLGVRETWCSQHLGGTKEKRKKRPFGRKESLVLGDRKEKKGKKK